MAKSYLSSEGPPPNRTVPKCRKVEVVAKIMSMMNKDGEVFKKLGNEM